MIERVLAFKAEGSTNGFASMVVGTFMKGGGLAAHIETLRAAYRERRDAMYEALAREMPAGVTWTRTEGGFFLWLTVPSKADMAKVTARAAEERVIALPGTECFPDGRGTHNLRLAFSLQPPDRIVEGIRSAGPGHSRRALRRPPAPSDPGAPARARAGSSARRRRAQRAACPCFSCQRATPSPVVNQTPGKRRM